jgi:GntR family transcriptional regulator/MocR family aminotransferase
VVPAELATAFLRAARLTALAQPVLEQAVVAAFMRKGHFVRHIRRMRILYADRRRALASALRVAFGERITLEPAAGGMHLLVRFPGVAGDTELVRHCAMAGLGPSALSPLAMAHDCGHGLLLGFTNIAAEDATAVAARLADVIG